MDQAAGFGSGIVGIIIAVFLFVMAILAFLMPWFIYQIKNELTRIRKTMDTLTMEIEASRKEREAREKLMAAKKVAAKKNIKKKSWDELKREEKAEKES